MCSYKACVIGDFAFKRRPPGDREKDEFNEIMAAFYGALTRALSIDDATVLQQQVGYSSGSLLQSSRIS